MKSFRQTVATPRKWPGRCSPSSPIGGACRLDPGREARPGRARSAAGAKSRSTPCSAANARVARRGRADTPSQVAGSANCAGLTNRLATTTSHSARAALEERDVPCVQRAHRRHEPDRAPLAQRARAPAELARSCASVCIVGLQFRADTGHRQPTGRCRPTRGAPSRRSDGGRWYGWSPMPIYEYVCMSCESHFEELVRHDETPKCPDCGAAKVQRQFSVFAAPRQPAAQAQRRPRRRRRGLRDGSCGCH